MKLLAQAEGPKNNDGCRQEKIATAAEQSIARDGCGCPFAPLESELIESHDERQHQRLLFGKKCERKSSRRCQGIAQSETAGKPSLDVPQERRQKSERHK